MKKVVFLLSLIFIVACSSEPSGKATEEHNIQTLLTNLDVPWDIEIHQSELFISERDGSIVSWEQGEEAQRMPVQTEREIVQEGESGLLGFKLHPDFASNHLAFLYHSYKEGSQMKNRVILVEMKDEKWVETAVVLDGIPGAVFHNGGRVEIGPDGKLYVTTGDALEENLARDIQSLAGKILRMNLDGSLPSDNPFFGSYIYSYGHRNPQGLAWRDNGQLYASEHGPDNHDEINIIESGGDYGWPDFIGEETGENTLPPLYQTGEETWAPSGITFYRNRLYVAALRGNALMSLTMDGTDPEVVTDDYGRIRDVEIFQDNLLFITNNTDGRGNPDEKDDRLLMYHPEKK